MKKRILSFVLTLILLLVSCSLLLASCNNQGSVTINPPSKEPNTKETSAQTTATDSSSDSSSETSSDTTSKETTNEETTNEGTTEQTDTEEETSSENTTSEETTEETSFQTTVETENTSDTSEETESSEEDTTESSDTSYTEHTASNDNILSGNSGTVELEWTMGAVCSSEHTLFPNQIYALSQYSYSNVFTVPKAGTKITFVDSESQFAAKTVYVFSSWKKDTNGEWSLDTDGINYAGSSGDNSRIASSTSSGVIYTYITSYDNESLRISYYSGHTKTKTPEFSKVTFSKTNQKGTYTQQLEYEASTTLPDPSILNGKTLYAIGDSYFEGHTMDKKYVWPQLLADKHNMSFRNFGISGSTMSNHKNCVDNNPMVDRVPNFTAPEPDIILLEGGRNDRNKNVPMGTKTSTDTTTYMGAVNFLITTLKNKYPNALIICVTAWQVNDANHLGFTTTDYAKAMIEVCNYRGVICFDASDIQATGVNMTSVTFRTQYCLTSSDVSHLNIEGHKYVLPVFEEFILRQYGAFIA